MFVSFSICRELEKQLQIFDVLSVLTATVPKQFLSIDAVNFARTIWSFLFYYFQSESKGELLPFPRLLLK